MDISSMTSLLDQSMLLNYSYRNMYVKNLLSSNGLSSTSSKTLTAQLDNEKSNPTRQLVKVTSGEDTFVTGITDGNTAFKNATEALSKSSVLKVSADNATGTASSDAIAQDYTLNVQQLATSQVSGGKVIGTYGKDFAVGENTLEITVGDVTKTVSFNVSDSDTNKDSLNKMINAINKSGLDIVASVGSTGSSSTTNLVLKSKNTGTDNAFSVKDVKGNAVSVTDADKVTKAATNAVFSVDGSAVVSQSNNIELQDGKVKLTLTKADGKDHSLKIQQDSSNALDSIVNFVNQYNSMVSLANANKSYSNVAKGLESRLRSYAAENFGALKEIGITYNSGVMKIDQDKLKDSLTNKTDQVNSLFGNNGKLVVNANTEITGLENLQKSSQSNTTYRYEYSFGKTSDASVYSNFYDILF